MDYVSPGGAFSSAFADSQLQRQQLARQAMLDDLTRRKTEAEIVSGQELLTERRAENAQKIKDQEETSVRKRVADMLPGDIPDAELVAAAQKYHIPLRTAATAPTVTGVAGDTAIPESMPGIAAVPLGQSQAGITPTRTGMVANPAAGPTAGIRFAGTPAQVTEREERAAAAKKEADILAERKLEADQRAETARQAQLDREAAEKDRVAQAHRHDELLATIAAANRTSRESEGDKNRGSRERLASLKGQVDKLDAAQQAFFKSQLQSDTHFWTSDEERADIAQKAYDAAKALKTGGGGKPAVDAILKKLGGS